MIQIGTVAENNDKTVTEMNNHLSEQLYPNFRSVVEIFDKSILEHSVRLNTRGRNDRDGTSRNVLKQVLNFCKETLQTALHDNVSSRFDCFTLNLCQKFQVTLDTSSYFYPSNMHFVDDPFSSNDTFSEFVDGIPFVSENEQGRETLLFQLFIMRSVLMDLATQVRET